MYVYMSVYTGLGRVLCFMPISSIPLATAVPPATLPNNHTEIYY